MTYTIKLGTTNYMDKDQRKITCPECGKKDPHVFRCIYGRAFSKDTGWQTRKNIHTEILCFPSLYGIP